jgi:hypothetical protein
MIGGWSPDSGGSTPMWRCRQGDAEKLGLFGNPEDDGDALGLETGLKGPPADPEGEGDGDGDGVGWTTTIPPGSNPGHLSPV